MRIAKAMQVMSALAQPTRMSVFRKLMETFPDGMAAGELANTTAASPAGMSAHLAIMQRAGVVGSRKVGRHVLYRAKPEAVLAVADFLAGEARTDATPAPEGTG